MDEPTIGQHPYDVKRLIPALRELKGPVVYVEHDRIAASLADQAVDIGPGAGVQGEDRQDPRRLQTVLARARQARQGRSERLDLAD